MSEDREVRQSEEGLNMGTLWNLGICIPRIGLLWYTIQAPQELDSEKDSGENEQEGEDKGQRIGELKPKDDVRLVFETFLYSLQEGNKISSIGSMRCRISERSFLCSTLAQQ
jgi:hypothetical protein